jgi:osmoprotectant transport system substrate-binding protein
MSRRRIFILLTALWAALPALVCLTGCAGSKQEATAAPTSASVKTLPGAGKPPITIGDKNFTEQFVLGQLYRQALEANGFSVSLNPNIGPTEVTLQALFSGRIDMYPEYLGTWDRSVAGYQRTFHTAHAAYQAAQRYALAHGLELLEPTAFSDTDAVVVGSNFAAGNGLDTIGDLRKVADNLTFGAPPQFQQSPDGLPSIERAYGFLPASFKALEVGEQYQALDQGSVQAADATTTDGELVSGNYTVLRDPMNVFGWGNVVPVVSAKMADAEGPAFAATINKVSSLLTTETMRQLNAAVDISHEDPATAAKRFLIAQGLLPKPPS